MPDQDLHATEAHHAEEVLDVVIPADHKPTKVMEPSEKSFDSPTSSVAAQRATILRRVRRFGFTPIIRRPTHRASIGMGDYLIRFACTSVPPSCRISSVARPLPSVTKAI